MLRMPDRYQIAKADVTDLNVTCRRMRFTKNQLEHAKQAAPAALPTSAPALVEIQREIGQLKTMLGNATKQFKMEKNTKARSTPSSGANPGRLRIR